MSKMSGDIVEYLIMYNINCYVYDFENGLKKVFPI